jgi:hypothetical protein
MVFNATFNDILVTSWWSVLLVEETGVSEENHRPVASHWQTLSLYVVSSTPRHELGSNLQLRYQRSNQKPLFEEGHINTMAKRKRTNNDKQNITQKTTQIHQYEAH